MGGGGGGVCVRGGGGDSNDRSGGDSTEKPHLLGLMDTSHSSPPGTQSNMENVKQSEGSHIDKRTHTTGNTIARENIGNPHHLG